MALTPNDESKGVKRIESLPMISGLWFVDDRGIIAPADELGGEGRLKIDFHSYDTIQGMMSH